MIDTVSLSTTSVEEFAVDSQDGVLCVVTRLSDIPAAHLHELVGIRDRLPLEAVGLPVTGAVFGVGEGFDVVWPVIPRNIVPVMDVLSHSLLKPVLGNREESVDVDASTRIVPSLVALVAACSHRRIGFLSGFDIESVKPALDGCDGGVEVLSSLFYSLTHSVVDCIESVSVAVFPRHNRDFTSENISVFQPHGGTETEQVGVAFA